MSKFIESLKYFTVLSQIRTNYVKYVWAVFLYRLKRKVVFPEAKVTLKDSRFLTRKNSMDIAHLSNLYEKDTTNFLMSLNPRIFIDVGAHVGRFSIISANKGSKVISIEPSKDNFIHLIKNIQLNKLQNKITAFNVGCSNKEGFSNLHFVSGNEGLSSLNKKERSIKEKIMVKKLDNICKSLNLDESSVDVIKIDVEGHELNVLKGALNLLKNSNPILIIEITDKNEEKLIKDFLEKIGFINKKILDSRNFIFIKD